jgi:hypothetical protein
MLLKSDCSSIFETPAAGSFSLIDDGNKKCKGSYLPVASKT